jgi:hypothetical protein
MELVPEVPQFVMAGLDPAIQAAVESGSALE